MVKKSLSARERERQEFMKRRATVARTHGETSSHRVYELLRAGLRDGSITSQDQLMEHLLVKTYGASRNSVRRALQLLTEQGLLSRERRRGTNPAHEIIQIVPTEVGPRAWAGASHGGRLSVDTITCATMPISPELERRMGHAGNNVVVIEQVGAVDGEPLYFRTGFNATDLTAEEFRGLIDATHEEYPPLPEAFRRFARREYGWSTFSIEAVAIDKRAADFLRVEPGSPALLRELATFGIDGLVSELSFTYFAPGRVALSDRGISNAGFTA